MTSLTPIEDTNNGTTSIRIENFLSSYSINSFSWKTFIGSTLTITYGLFFFAIGN